MAACWRCATIPTMPRRWTTHGIEPIDLLVVNLYPVRGDGGGGRRLRGLHREYRHRRAGDDPRRRPRTTATWRWSPTPAIMRRCWRSWTAQDGATPLAFRQGLALTAFARTAAYDAAVSGWMAGAIEAATPRRRELCRACWRRRCAMARTRTRRRPSTATARGAAGRGDGAAAAGQGAVLQQHQRHRRGLRAGGGVRAGRRAGLRDHQARQSLRGGAGGDRCSRPIGAAYDCDRTSAFGGIVALNRPLDEATAAEIVEDLHRGGDRAGGRARPRGRCSRRRRTCGC